PNLPLLFPTFTTNTHADVEDSHLRLRFSDQHPTNALATGQSKTWMVTLTTNASVFPLRATLVWTDPPGNPNVGVKLVNDLDLMVTNLDTGNVFYGNNIPASGDFSTASQPAEGEPLPTDIINNVENILIRAPNELGRRFSVTVVGRRVNVNSVT